jgi:glyoxylase I family protein
MNEVKKIDVNKIEVTKIEVTGIDHIYIAVSDLPRSEKFYDTVLLDTLDFRKNTFALGGEPHIQYFNRHFGYVLRPSATKARPDVLQPGLHHLCLRVDTPADVAAVAARLRKAGIDASNAKLYPIYAPDYWASYLTDPDGIRLEITNYRQERRERHDNW